MESLAPLGRLCNSASQFLKPVEFRPVRTIEELRDAMHLVYREYVKRGYMKPCRSQFKHSIFQALPTTTTFIAKHHSAGVIATLTLVEDSPIGLPMDEIYKAEIDTLRKRGLRVSEASMLALDSRLFGKGVFTLFHSKKLLLTLRLFKTFFDYMRSCTDCDEIVACFNPKHETLYEFLQLKTLGGIKKYFGANGNPAVARHLNVAETEAMARAHPAYKLFFSEPDKKRFENRLVYTPEQLQFIFTEATQLLQSASPTELSHIQSCYPEYNFADIIAGRLTTTEVRSALQF